MEKLVSLIIPAYNVEDYLEQCLESAINQTLSNIEIICVNDGSTDRTGDIFEIYARKDARVKVINQQNGGLSVARNTGLQAAGGKYVSFLDSDDCLKPDALERLCDLAESQKLDHIIFAAEVFYDGYVPEEDTWTDYYTHKNPYGQIKSGPDCYADLVLNKDYVYAAQLRFSLRSRLVEKNIYFRPGMIHEDNLFSFINDLSAERAMILDEKPYLFRKRPDSITTGTVSMKHLIGYLVAFIECLKYANNKAFNENVNRAIDMDLNRKYSAACRNYKKVEDKTATKEMWLDCEMAKVLMPFILPENELSEAGVKRCLKPVKNPVVSVIIPVYNSEEYLVQCLESLRKQSLKEIEVICVDDGSSDNSAIILKFYELLDARFKTLTVSNKGAGAARNFAMRFAFGKYLAFFDADDWAEPDYLERMVEKAESEDSQVVLSRNKRYSQTQGEIVRETHFHSSITMHDGPITYRDAGDRVLIDFGNQPWAKLFRRSYVEESGLKFQEIVRANDLLFTQLAIIQADRLSILDEALYCYRIDIPNTLQSTNDKTPTLFLEAWSAFREAAQQNGKLEDVSVSLANAVWGGCLFTFERLHTVEARNMLFDILKNEKLSEFQIDRLTKDNCLNAKNYEKLQKFISSKSYEEFVG